VRILITGKNDNIPADVMQRTADPRTLGVSFPPAAARPPSATSCADLSITGGRAANFLPGREPQLGQRASVAPSFDATAEQWIVPPPGMKPGSGASAEQGHTQAAHKRSPVTPLPAGERAPHPVLEALTVALGLTVFGLIAGVFWILA
jgi:hypothetical protein